MVTNSSILAWRSPQIEKPGRLPGAVKSSGLPRVRHSPRGCKESDTTEQLTLSLHFHRIDGYKDNRCCERPKGWSHPATLCLCLQRTSYSQFQGQSPTPSVSLQASPLKFFGEQIDEAWFPCVTKVSLSIVRTLRLKITTEILTDKIGKIDMNCQNGPSQGSTGGTCSRASEARWQPLPALQSSSLSQGWE